MLSLLSCVPWGAHDLWSCPSTAGGELGGCVLFQDPPDNGGNQKQKVAQQAVELDLFSSPQASASRVQHTL